MATHDSSLALLDGLLEQARRHGADAADAVFIRSSDVSLSVRLGQQEHLERAESAGIGLRVFVGGRIAAVSTTDPSPAAFPELCERAIAMAKAAPPDPHAGLASAAQLATAIPALDLLDANEPSLEVLSAACLEAEDAARAMPGITNSQGADAAYSRYELALATSNGFAQTYEGSSHSISLAVVAGSGDDMQRDHDYTAARHRADLRTPRDVGEEAAKRTLARMHPRKAPSCQVPMVFDPRVSKSLVGAFLNAASGASVARGTSFLKTRMGEAVFRAGISIIDDPLRVRGHASRPFDGEGLANPALALVENGELKHWLLDIRSANQLGLPANGRGARSLSGTPYPTTSNVYLTPGSISPQAMIRDIERGFYVTETFGMGVNLVTGDYSQGASGMWIENGELTHAVSEVTIAGHLLSMFQSIAAADDLHFTYAINAPTLRVDGMTLAGA